MVILLLSSLASAAGVHTELGWVGSYGPDAYGTLELGVSARPGLTVGALMVGGTRSGLYASASREIRLGERVLASGELRLGMAEEDGAQGGVGLGLCVDAGPVDAVLEGGWTGGLGWQGQGGVDAPLSARWTLSPRIKAETWAGDRDPALRAALGARHTFAGGAWLGAELSAGGRDVFHLGPGLIVSVGRNP